MREKLSTKKMETTEPARKGGQSHKENVGKKVRAEDGSVKMLRSSIMHGEAHMKAFRKWM